MKKQGKNKKNRPRSSPVCYGEAKDLRPEFREKMDEKESQGKAGRKPES